MRPAGGVAAIQNTARSLALLRAVAVAHQQAQRAQTLSLGISILVAGLSVLAAVSRELAPAVTLLGALWAIGYASVVAPWASRSLRRGATLQETFDVETLGLPWNPVAVGDPVSDEEVSLLSRRFRGNEDRLRDYYVVADVPAPFDVYFCLEQNLAWGSRVRRRYAELLVTLLVAWCVAGVIVGIVAKITIGTLVSLWFVPSLGLLLFCLDIYQSQISITRERTRLLTILRAQMETEQRAGTVDPGAWVWVARQIQDVLFQLRRQQPRVPVWFFRRFHDNDKEDFQFKMRSLEERFGHPADRAVM